MKRCERFGLEKDLTVEPSPSCSESFDLVFYGYGLLYCVATFWGGASDPRLLLNDYKRYLLEDVA